MFVSVFSFFKNVPESIFWVSALFGTTLFVLRMLLAVIGGMSDEWSDGDDGLFDDGDGHHHHGGSFKLFTVHSLSGFFMMFGWVGLACTQQLAYSQQASLLLAVGAGFLTMLLTAFIFTWAQSLVSSGTRFNINTTVGMVGTVYQRISQREAGKILLVVDGVTRELLAQSNDSTVVIESFSVVRVVRVLDYETVVVEKV